MDPFDDFLADDPAQDIDLDIHLDGDDIMELDCDPDFNNFLAGLAGDPLACFDDAIVCEETSSYEKTALNIVTASGAEDSTSPPRSPSGSSGNESCQYGACSGAKCALPYQVTVGTGKASIGRRGKADTEDMRSLRVKERNRLYAARTRQRKNRLLEDLRQRCSDLEAENAQLHTRVMHLQEEVDGMRHVKSAGTGAVASCGGNQSSPTPSTNTECPVSGGPGLLSVKPAAVRAQPNQKAKNKLRFTAAAAAACPPQEDAAPAPQNAGANSTGSHGGDSRGVASSDTFRGNGTIQSYPGAAAHFVVKAEPDHATSLKRPADCSRAGTARRVRGRGALSSRSQQAPLSMATIGMLALAAVSCLVLVAFPALSIMSPGAAPVEPAGLMAASSHTRALLSDTGNIHAAQRLALAANADEDGLVPYQKQFPDVVHDEDYMNHEAYDDWVGVDDDAHHVLLSAAFVCNHTTCVAVPKGGGSWTRVVPQIPVELRQEDTHARNSLEASVFSALGAAGVTGQHHPASFSAGEHLRGDMQPDSSGAQSSKYADSDGGSNRQSTSEALSMAGLLAPQSCELVLRSRGAARNHATGSEIAQPFSASARPNAVVPSGGDVASGGVALLKSVVQERTAGQQQQVMIGKGLNHSENQSVVSVLFPAWQNQVEEDGVLTPMRHMYVLVAEGDDLLTYECSLSRALYI